MKKLFDLFAKRRETADDKGHRGHQMEIDRTCECGHTHRCHETFREMVERCATERDGSPIIC